MEIYFHRLKYFIAAAETLSFTKAAQNMFISPQALNQQIIKLEEELGCELFVRSTRTVCLSETGERLYADFAPTVKRYDEACKSFEQWQKKQKNILKIGYLEAISREDVVKPVIQNLQLINPDLKVQIHAGQLNEVNRWMQEGSIDLCITNVHEYEIWCSSYEQIEIFRMPAVAVTALDHPWSGKERITKTDMAQYPILLMKQPKDMEKESFYSIVQSSERVYYPNYESILMNMETGPYYSVFPKYFDEKVRRDKLQSYELPEEYRFWFQMCLIYRSDNRFADVFHELVRVKDSLHIRIK
jgi:DNA-binding transcriptional LysR family regulator